MGQLSYQFWYEKWYKSGVLGAKKYSRSADRGNDSLPPILRYDRQNRILPDFWNTQ